MTEKTDETARNVARNDVRDVLSDGEIDSPEFTADGVLDWFVTVTWEREWHFSANAEPVAVRRYVLRGAWEVDPERVAVSEPVESAWRGWRSER